MISQNKGTIVLHTVPNSDVEQKISTFLNRYIPNISKEKVATIVEKAPVILMKNVSEKAGKVLVNKLKTMGAVASYEVGNESKKSSSEIQRINHEEEKLLQNTQSASPARAVKGSKGIGFSKSKDRILALINEVNKELWLILSMIVLVGIMNYLLTAHRMLLGLYTLPTLFSAYYYGRRHATLTAIASAFLVGLFIYFKPSLFSNETHSMFIDGQWFEIISWSGILVITAYAMGTLYEKNSKQVQELRATYHGLLMILRQFISKDDYTENHCYRVSIYASKIAGNYGCKSEQIEDIRAASLLHDIGKLDISRELLYKAANFTKEEFQKMKYHAEYGASMLEPVGGPLGRIIPIVISHHEKFDGSGYKSTIGQQIPVEARIISVADVYDALVSDRPYRKAMSPFEAKEIITKGSGTDFDPSVVEAFLKAFQKGDMEIPNVIV